MKDIYEPEKEMRDLLCDLEYIVGNEVDNSARGSIRYPLSIRDYERKEY